MLMTLEYITPTNDPKQGWHKFKKITKLKVANNIFIFIVSKYAVSTFETKSDQKLSTVYIIRLSRH
jgi:hypothetical protein